MGGKKKLGERMVRTARGRFLYTGGHDGGGVYKTAYRATIPKTAKLTTRGNSQVLALQFQRLKTDTAKLNRRTSNKLQSWVSDDPDIDLSVAFPSEGAQNGKWEERQTNRTTWKQHRTDSSDPYIPSLSHINDILMKAFAETSKAATMATT